MEAILRWLRGSFLFVLMLGSALLGYVLAAYIHFTPTENIYAARPSQTESTVVAQRSPAKPSPSISKQAASLPKQPHIHFTNNARLASDHQSLLVYTYAVRHQWHAVLKKNNRLKNFSIEDSVPKLGKLVYISPNSVLFQNKKKELSLLTYAGLFKTDEIAKLPLLLPETIRQALMQPTNTTLSASTHQTATLAVLQHHPVHTARKQNHAHAHQQPVSADKPAISVRLSSAKPVTIPRHLASQQTQVNTPQAHLTQEQPKLTATKRSESVKGVDDQRNFWKILLRQYHPHGEIKFFKKTVRFNAFDARSSFLAVNLGQLSTYKQLLSKLRLATSQAYLMLTAPPKVTYTLQLLSDPDINALDRFVTQCHLPKDTLAVLPTMVKGRLFYQLLAYRYASRKAAEKGEQNLPKAAALWVPYIRPLPMHTFSLTTIHQLVTQYASKTPAERFHLLTEQLVGH